MKLIFAFSLLLSPSAFACGGWGCYSSACLTYGPVTADNEEFDVCRQEQLTHLDPNNRTETNLQVLAWELSGAKSTERSQPDFYSGDEARGQENLPPEDQRTDFYKGVAAFREEDYEKAVGFFSKVRDSEIDVPKALYYTGRAYLRWSQKSFDGYNYDTLSSEYVLKARDAFKTFAKSYPEHEWAPSAKGLIRRASYLAGDVAAYSDQWGVRVDEALAASPRDETTLRDLFEEAGLLDLKAVTSAKHLHPVLWMMRVYYVTRQFNAETPVAFDLKEQLASLDADQSAFKKYRDLYAWSRAVLLYKMGRAQEGYDLLQKQSVAKTNTGSLSWLVLNARLLMALNRFDEARSLIEPYIRAHPVPATQKRPRGPSDQPAIASYPVSPHLDADENEFDGYPYQPLFIDSRNFYSMTYVWEKKAASIATKKNLDLLGKGPLTRIFTQGTTGEEMLAVLRDTNLDKSVRTAIEPVTIAKLIATGQWSLAADAYALIETPKVQKDFSQLGKAAKTLSSEPDDPEAIARVAIYRAYISPVPHLFAACEKQKLTPHEANMDLFVKALEGFKASPKKKNPLEATLLREMLLCFKDTNFGPACGVSKYEEKSPFTLATRRSWFRRLKTRFPNSKEAKETTVFW